MKTAVLIHGCHLQAKDWENIIWGCPEVNVLGRIPKGLLLAAQEDAELVYWGTGASEVNGVKESRKIFAFAATHSGSLVYDGFGLNEKTINKLLSRSFIDTESQNTLQEVRGAMQLCAERGIERLILVSSPTHIARCLQCAERVRAEGGFENLQVFATASDTCFADSTPDDVLIVEPPHRGDRAEIPLHKTLKLAMFARKLDDEKAHKFNEELTVFLENQKRKLLT